MVCPEILEYASSLNIFEGSHAVLITVSWGHLVITKVTTIIFEKAYGRVVHIQRIPEDCNLEHFKEILGQYVNLPEDGV
jgi:hypothetical protein